MLFIFFSAFCDLVRRKIVSFPALQWEVNHFGWISNEFLVSTSKQLQKGKKEKGKKRERDRKKRDGRVYGDPETRILNQDSPF